MATVIAHCSTFSTAYLYDTSTRLSYPVVLTQIGAIQRPLGIRADLNVLAFAGAQSDRPVTGVWLSYEAKVARNAWLSLGPALDYRDGRIGSPGIVVGLRIDF